MEIGLLGLPDKGLVVGVARGLPDIGLVVGVRRGLAEALALKPAPVEQIPLFAGVPSLHFPPICILIILFINYRSEYLKFVKYYQSIIIKRN